MVWLPVSDNNSIFLQGVSTIRELEDLIIEGTNNNVLRGKLDQKSSHFEVDYAMGRDIKKVQFIKDLNNGLVG